VIVRPISIRWTGGQERPDPEVPEKARRRTFTAQYKQEVLAAYEAAANGEKGAILRREGLYSSPDHRVAAGEGRRRFGGPGPAARRRIRGTRRSPRCRKRKPKLEQELAKARFVADVQSKLQALLA
jgi:transposase